MTSVAGKTILITGGGSGIGAASALYLASKGANVVITGRKEATLKQVASESKGGKVIPVVADATSESDWERVISTTLNLFGGIDAAIMNAGWEGPGVQDAVETSVADVQQLLAINVLGPILGAKFCVPSLLKSKGALILVSSVVSALPRTAGTVPLYGATKAAVDALVRQLSGAYSPKGIRVFGVNPVVYESAMFRNASNAPSVKQIAPTPEDVAGMFNPLGNIGDPVDFGVVYHSLLTTATNYKSGDCICVIPSLTPGKPLTFEVTYMYTNVTGSSAPDALYQGFLSMPLQDATGAELAPAEADPIRAKIKEHVTALLVKFAAMAATAAAK